MSTTASTHEQAAKAAKEFIHSRGEAIPATQDALCAFYGEHRQEILDDLTHRLLSYASFEALLAGKKPGAIPNIQVGLGWRHELLADEYDETQEARGDARRIDRRDD